MKIFYQTFGCKVNSYETATLTELMESRGHTTVSSPLEADCAIVNSCAVTAAGESKSVRALSAAKRANPGVITVLCGCVPQAFPEKYAGREDIDIIAGNAARAELPEKIESFAGERILEVTAHSREELFEDLPLSAMPDHTRAFIKIEDGCDCFCSYCVIPYARGRVRSMPLDSLRRHCRELTEAGYKELVLCGINLQKYGLEFGLDLADAAAAAAESGALRVRLSSLEPELVTEELLKKLSAVPELCPQFHLALQSGCDRTLKAMNRRYDTALFRRSAELVRRYFPDATFTTDVMVGFPGETEDDFLESLRFIKDFGFLKCHIFPYSIRPGTAAAKLPGQLPRAEKQRRVRIMGEAAEQSRREIMAGFSGSSAEVLIEQPEKGWLTGYTRHYVPCRLPLDAGQNGDIVTCRLLPPENGFCPAAPIE